MPGIREKGGLTLAIYDQEQKYYPYKNKSEVTLKEILLTMRALDEKGKWLQCRKVYDLDENGERIRLPSGRWKSHKEYTVD